MNAVVVQHPNSHAFRGHPRLETEVRRLRADALWITLHKDAATGLQNFTPDLVSEFHRLVEDLQYGRSPSPGYAVIQSADPEYFSMGGDLRFFRDCIQRRDATRFRTFFAANLGSLSAGLATPRSSWLRWHSANRSQQIRYGHARVRLQLDTPVPQGHGALH